MRYNMATKRNQAARLSPYDTPLKGQTSLRPETRRGSVFGLFVGLLPVLAVLAAVAVNAAYMQLARTELIVATDLAAHAGGRAMSEFQDVDLAIASAQATAARNLVAGQPLMLNPDDSANQIEFGRTNNSSGNYTRFNFQKLNTQNVRNHIDRASAVRVTGSRTQASLGGPIDFVFPSFTDRLDFEPTFQSVAMQVDRDVCLVLDRSGSMTWITWNWPSGINPWSTTALNAGVAAGILTRSRGNYFYASGQNADTYQAWAWTNHFNLGPAPRAPWADLLAAVDAFLNVLEDTPQEEKVAVASYASSGSLNCQLQSNYGIVRSTVNALVPNGATAIGLGMNSGIVSLINSNARPYAAKTMVVMTDGIHNTGISPVTVATNLMNQYALTIHTVTFGADADIARMTQVAEIGGGNHYHAATGADLVAIFEEIANNVATITTE